MSSTIPSSGKFILVAKFVAIAGKEDRMMELLKAVRDRAVSDSEPGTLTYRTTFDKETRSFLVFEEYANAEAHTAHASGPAFQNFIAVHKSEGLFEDTLDVKYYQEI